jgi:AraC family transcriptional regulator of adaptative response/methylated-DNA-[protein]-cysteine methyltransferase
MPSRFQLISPDYGRQLLTEAAIGLRSSIKEKYCPPLIEIKTQAKDKTFEINYGFHRSPFGACLIAITSGRLCAVFFLDKGEEENQVADLHRRWPKVKLIKDQKATQPWVKRIFPKQVNIRGAKIPVTLMGTEFQLKVWRALLRIKPGGTVPYEEVAGMIGQPNAIRAAGTAVGANPLGYLIPCHRVIRKSGAIGNYRWGVRRKKAMLGLEALSR